MVHSFDMLTFDFLLKLPQPITGLFFLMFGHEAAVKHTLLESENPKYLRTNDGMINVG